MNNQAMTFEVDGGSFGASLRATLTLALTLVGATLLAQAPAGGERPVAQPARHVLPITEVVVYEDRALVTREGEVPVAGGVETVVVGGLPPGLAETSLRAGLADVAAGRVISISSDVTRLAEIQDTRLRAAEEELRGVERRIAEIDDGLQQLALRETYVGAYEKLLLGAISERTGGDGDPATAAWSEALKFLAAQRAAILAGRRDATARKKTLEESLAVASAEVDKLRRPEERSVRSAEVVLEAAAAGRTRLRVSYVMGDASWKPRYDARYDAATGELDVTYFGELRQSTGEDWTQARLVLSTARPATGASRPELQALRLASLDAPAGGKRIAHRAEAAGEVPVAGVRLDFAGEAPAVTDGATALLLAESRENATSAVFTVPGAATIPADGRSHKAPVVTFREKAQTTFETVPKLERFVYLKASSRNASPYPMLAGPVEIYRGSGFIGTSALKFVAPGRPFEVSLGIEESLKVRRETVTDAREDDGRTHRQAFEIELESFAEKASEVTLIEHHPVSDVEEVRVELDRSTTPPAAKSEKDGMLRWQVSLRPGETRKVRVEYTVRYPAGVASR
jgi:uncharacterized protein (TIGR02231 family)